MIGTIKEQTIGMVVMDTIGQRIKLEMIHKDLKQADILRQLNERGIELQKSQMSKIINDEVTMYAPAMLIEIARIFGVDTHYLLTGEERGEEKAWSDESTAVAAIVDNISRMSDRHIIQSVVEKVTQLHPEHWEFMLSVVTSISDKVSDVDKLRRTYAGELFDERKSARLIPDEVGRSAGNGK